MPIELDGHAGGLPRLPQGRGLGAFLPFDQDLLVQAEAAMHYRAIGRLIILAPGFRP